MGAARRSGLAAAVCAIACALTLGLTAVASAEGPPDHSGTDADQAHASGDRDPADNDPTDNDPIDSDPADDRADSDPADDRADGAGTDAADEAPADDEADQAADRADTAEGTGSARSTANSGSIDLNKPVTDQQLITVTDFLMFKASMRQFQYERRLRVLDDQVSWQATACDRALKDPIHDFTPACQRREFGYRNFTRQERFSAATRDRTDRKFTDDLRAVCADKNLLARATCERQADVYAGSVRQFD